MNDRLRHPIRSLRERHGRFYVGFMLEKFEDRDAARRCFLFTQ